MKVHEIIAAIRYQLPLGVTTMMNCTNGCGELARGGRECIDCLTLKLGKLTDSRLAQTFTYHTQSAHEAINELLGNEEE